jgi:hypothetical protein
MSEFQYVAFRALDAPVSAKNLQFMRQQSTRAEITPWSFENHYSFGDFHGDAPEMLRRGYDFHFHYADFGIRKLMIRFPTGLPALTPAKPYLKDGSLRILKDKHGPGTVLCIQPFIEPGEEDELIEPEVFFDRLLPLRAEILNGDLRPLYLAHLAVACDGEHDPEEEYDAPVPAGLNKLTDAQHAMAELFGLSDELISAAADNSPALPRPSDVTAHFIAWLQQRPDDAKNRWLSAWMADCHSSVRNELLAEYQKSHPSPPWPTTRLQGTVAQIRAAADAILEEQNRHHAEQTARQRAKDLAKMAADPTKVFSKVERLVSERTTHAYQQAAALLADLKEALAGSDQSNLAERHARKLKETHSTLRNLIAALRSQGFLKDGR